jgi:hypothetical protein
MPQTCKICRHASRTEIDRALLAAEPLRSIADRWSVSKTALIRHRGHIQQAVAKTHEAQELVRAGSLMAGVQTAHDRSEELYDAATGILKRAEKAQDLRTALRAITCAVGVMGEARAYLELQGQLTGELSEAPQGHTIIQIGVFGAERAADGPPDPPASAGQPTAKAPGAVTIDVKR